MKVLESAQYTNMNMTFIWQGSTLPLNVFFMSIFYAFYVNKKKMFRYEFWGTIGKGINFQYLQGTTDNNLSRLLI